MAQNVAQKLIGAHLVEGEMSPGSEIGLRIDQTLTQDATGTLVMLELEAMGLDRVRTEVSVQYVDHNLLQTDERNMADHLFLRSACQRFGGRGRAWSAPTRTPAPPARWGCWPSAPAGSRSRWRWPASRCT